MPHSPANASPLIIAINGGLNTQELVCRVSRIKSAVLIAPDRVATDGELVGHLDGEQQQRGGDDGLVRDVQAEGHRPEGLQPPTLVHQVLLQGGISRHLDFITKYLHPEA